jgi:3-hydroxyacyl-CoA dehydrogenase / enoyl-CoA hydratase / 3-hydroxybutyryl-CoA epimerase
MSKESRKITVFPDSRRSGPLDTLRHETYDPAFQRDRGRSFFEDNAMSRKSAEVNEAPEKSEAKVPAAPGRVEIKDGVAWIHLDDPAKAVNTLSTRTFGWFESQLAQLENQNLRGLVFVSDKKGYWVVGADIEELGQLKDSAAVLNMIRQGHKIVARLQALPFPTIAAIDGACLGGGLELALACDVRVATDAKHSKLGLPEVQLGIFPGLGGTQRLPRLIDVPDALDLILTGKQVDAKKAKKLGLIDEVCHPAVLAEAALAWVAKGKPRGQRQPPKKAFAAKAADLLARTPLAQNFVYDQAKKTVLAKSGGHYPAPLVALEVVRKGMALPLDQALDLEARQFAEIVMSPVAKALIGIFFTKNDVEGRAKSLGKGARPIEKLAVLGAGFMGSGIAQGLAYKGYEVLLKDRDHAAVGRGLKHCNDLFGEMVKRRKLSEINQKLLMGRIQPTVDYTGFGRVPFVIEAVFEDLEVKHKVIREVEKACPEGVIFASNTSTIPIADLAAASRQPENVVGMHFFSPVHKMPLLEIIKHPKTSNEALATTVEIGRKMGKTIIVVNDGPGFFTSRVLGPFVNEALFLLEQGARIEQIDKVMTGWGWPVGPLALLDEVGLDIAFHAGKVMAQYAGSRAKASPIFDLMITDGRLGRKVGKGFYDYRKKPKRVSSSIYDVIFWDEKPVADQEIIERCWFQMLNETARCIEEGIITNPNDIDIGVIFGFGFPPFRGGILREADRVGVGAIVDKLDRYASTHGKRLEPAQLLRDMAARGERFHKT